MPLFHRPAAFFLRSAPFALLALLILLAATGALPVGVAHAADAPRVAVFAEPGFPFYGATPLLKPQQIADNLRAAGVTADVLPADALADPKRFRRERYAAVVLPYGNTYPRDAFANLRAFHRAGGSLVVSGIPFTHAAARLSARNWTAEPGWGDAVQLAPGEGPQGAAAVTIHTRGDGWTGLTSERFVVRPGDRVSVRAAIRETTRPGDNTTGDDDRDDNVFVRYFDANGRFLGQFGPRVENAPTNRFALFAADTVAPPEATQADVSIQMRRGGRRFLVGSIAATRNGQKLAIPNADWSRCGDAWVDIGHDSDAALFGPNGIGVGGFAGPATGRIGAEIAPGDPLHLTALGVNWTGDARPQYLDMTTLPGGVTVVPARGDKMRPIAALIVHNDGPFRGAVDVWAFRGAPDNADETEPYASAQLFARSALAALARRGLLSSAQETRAVAALDALPRPPTYADLVLPAPPKGYDTFQPKMPPPARRLVVADVRKLGRDEKILLISLQGLVNRSQPRLYLVFDDDDAFWLDEMRRQGQTDAPERVADPLSVVARFRDAYQGAVVADPKVYMSPAVAASIAGADDLLLATPDLARRLRLTTKTDLRGKFRDGAEALRFLRTEIVLRLDPYLSCCLNPSVFDAGGLDQIIAARGSVFWITGPQAQTLPGANQAGEMAEVRALFARMPLGAVVRGFWATREGTSLTETEGVALGSRFGKVTLVSDLITNLSVHSGVRADRLEQKPRAAPPPLDRSKVYLAFTMSDGDNLCTWRGYFRRYFNDPLRGSFPVGWGMGPSLIDLALVWARWYYANATPNDEFLCDVSGIAYIYPPAWATALKDRDGALRYFYDRTAAYMGRMDMKAIRLMNVGEGDIARIGSLLPGLSFLVPDYGWAGPKTYAALTYTLPGTGQSVFRAATSGRGPENLARQIRERTSGTRPAFINAFIWNWGSTLEDLKKTLDLLGPDYVAVLPSQLDALYRQSKGTSADASTETR